ncbi:cupin [Macrococcoides bohemicum]|uniref:cupin domain-containing protein n=1 Tax=Macrococcoides bohemicum TaxID=1903056 RepID=UPI001059E2F3|nr:cupin [Macrococcus bohemicus]TDL38288.1 cupin [Macrococcus bohemicus]
MKILDIKRENAIRVDKFDSLDFYINRITNINSKVMINIANLDSNGVIGSHKAPVNQLLIVTNGEGKVRTNTTDFIPISINQAVFFNAGEVHETRSDTGMVAIIIESPDLNYDSLLIE